MAVQQTECYRLVTIGYLKNFIGTNIQKSDGTTFTISRTDDTYCPTYKELTNGSIVPYWKQGTTVNGDTDGIVVNSNWYGGTSSAYTSTQNVDRADMQLKYTRYKSFSIAADPTTISECGGTSDISYTKKYTRTTNSMNTSCVTASSSSEVSDTTDSEVTLTTDLGTLGSWNNHKKVLTIDKNGTISADTRTATVTGKMTFRESEKFSTATITQSALTGDYTKEVSTRTVTTAVTATATTETGFTCSGGTYKAEGTKWYDTYKTYSWVDSCGTDYPSEKKEKQTGTGTSASMGEKSGTFSELNCCDYATGTNHIENGTITFADGDKSKSVSFKQTCAGCSGEGWTWIEDTTKAKTTAYTVDLSSTGKTYDCDGGSETVSATGKTIVTTYLVGKDSCGHIDSTRTSTSANTTSAASSSTVSFGVIDPCDYATGTTRRVTSAVTFTRGNITKTADYTQICSGTSGSGITDWIQEGTPTATSVTTYTIQAYAKTSQTFPCTGGNFSANAVETATTVTTTKTPYVKKDSCGHIVSSKTETTTADTATTTTLSTESGSFDGLDCCGGDQTRTETLTFTSHDKTCAIDFVQTCPGCTAGCTPDCYRIVDDGCWFEGGQPRLTCVLLAGSGNTTWNATDMTYVKNLTINNENMYDHYSVATAYEINGWLKVYRDPTEYGDLHYWYAPYTEDDGTKDDYHKWREAEFIYNTTDDFINPTHASIVPTTSAACSSTRVIIRQALCGYKGCKTGSHIEYTTVPSNSSCCSSPEASKCSSGNCTNCEQEYDGSCPSPSLYTFTVSTAPGATAVIGGKTYITNSAGRATHTSSSSNAVSATVSKSGCTFNGGSSATVSIAANTVVTIQYNCESCSTCLQANVRDITTMSPLPSTVGGGVIITFVTNCSNVSKYIFTHISGAQILSDITCSYYDLESRMIVSASYDANTFTTSRNEIIGITFNGTICKTVSIVQKPKST